MCWGAYDRPLAHLSRLRLRARRGPQAPLSRREEAAGAELFEGTGKACEEKGAEEEVTVADDMVYLAIELGIFEIDSQGRIWRTARQQTSRWGGETKIVKCKRQRSESPGDGRYFQVRVMFEGVRWIIGAHRLVWRHFNGKIPDGLTINHKDGKKKRNHPDNLELATRSEQSLHAVRVLGWKPRLNLGNYKQVRGVHNGMAALTERAVRHIRSTTKTNAALARRYAVSPATIHRVRTRKLWTHI